jgi:hypothetical protein
VDLPDGARSTHQPPRSGNSAEGATVGPQRVELPESPAVIVRPSFFGKRALQPLFEWEGVVEHIDGDGFRSRIVPLQYGEANSNAVEITEFSYDDLSTESDRSLVIPGAVFYWTIGRSRNAAGTITNQSLVRFRRLPPPTAGQVSESEREAAWLLSVVGDADGNGSNPAGQ